MPGLAVLHLTNRDELAFLPLTPGGMLDADREETAEQIAPAMLWLSKLKGTPRELLVEILRRSNGRYVIGTARWFALLEQIVKVKGATLETVGSFVAFATKAPDEWLPEALRRK